MSAPLVPASDLPSLLARARTGEAQAFAEVVVRFKPSVFRWAVALTGGDADEAEDITQEVFVRVHRKLSSYRGDGSFEGWMYSITRRVMLRSRRKASVREVNASTTGEVYVTDPGARVDQERAIALIRVIADTLPFRQREVFVLCDLEGRTPAEAGVLLGLLDVSVRASLFKARVSIRRSILANHPRYVEELK